MNPYTVASLCRGRDVCKNHGFGALYPGIRTRFELGSNSVGSEMCVETIGFGVFYLRVRTRFELGFELRLGEMPMKTNTFASSAGRTPFSI